MAIELKVPQVGESITEVQIGHWLKRQGERAEKDEAVVEIETDKATVELPAPVSGVISQVMKAAGQVAAVGEVIGIMEESGDGAASVPAETAKPVAASAGAASSSGAAQTSPAPPGRSLAVGGTATQSPGASAAKAQPAPAAQAPTPAPAPQRAPTPQPAPRPQPAPVGPVESAPPAQAMVARTANAAVPSAARSEEVVPMSMIRRRIAERLVQAQQQAALLTTFNEIDMSAVIALRKEQGPTFQEKFGVKLGFMSFFVKAAIEALKLVPQVNAEIRGNEIVYRNYYDIGIAVGGGKGLVVPVIRNAERMSFAEVELAIAELGARAREGKITPEDLEGGTFTITNGGIYGSLLSTPIVNPPQSGILGMHAIQDRPIAHDGQVVIRPMMYVALTYDHRLVDGREAVTFLKRIKDIVENPLRMLLEI
jgi:2-oxoglutarate dehydrogenase E2 component (dihydrolipoamide succinyltransferase)